MKTTTLKVVSVLLVLAAAGACGKRNSGLTMSKAGTPSGAADYDQMTYNETPTSSTGGKYRYLTNGTDAQFLKLEGTDRAILFKTTLILRKANSKNLKTNEYHLVYDEFLACKDGSNQLRITHEKPSGEWTVSKGLLSAGNLATFQRDQAPKLVTDTSGKILKAPGSRPLTGRLRIMSALGEPEITKETIPLALAYSNSNYSQVVDDTLPTTAKAVADQKLQAVCKNIKTTLSADSATNSN